MRKSGKSKGRTGGLSPRWSRSATRHSAGCSAGSIPSIVFFSTLAGFAARCGLEKLGVGELPRTFAAAFVSSLIAGAGALLFDFKTSIAISTSVLYLVPGDPLLNAVIDVFDGHVLAGFSRLANASSVILAMALGLLASLAVLGGSAL